MAAAVTPTHCKKRKGSVLFRTQSFKQKTWLVPEAEKLLKLSML